MVFLHVLLMKQEEQVSITQFTTPSPFSLDNDLRPTCLVDETGGTGKNHLIQNTKDFSLDNDLLPTCLVDETGGAGKHYPTHNIKAFSPGKDQFWHGQGCPLSDIVRTALPLLTTASVMASSLIFIQTINQQKKTA